MSELEMGSTKEYPYTSLALYSKDGGCVGCAKPAGISLDGSDAFTITAWVYTESTADEKIIFSQNGGVAFSIKDGKLSLKWQSARTEGKDGESETVQAGINTIDFGCWNYVAAAYNGNEISYYCNGILVNSETYRGEKRNGTGDLYAGKSFYGYLRKVTLYKGALSKQDIANRTYSCEGAVLNMDFTMNPPQETVSGKQLAIIGGRGIVCHDYGAIFKDNGYLDITDDYGVNPGGIVDMPYSIQAWIYPNMADDIDHMTILTNTDPGNTAGIRLTLERRSDGLHLCLAHGFFDLNENRVISDAVVPNLQWTNIAAVYQDNSASIYINARLHREKDGLFPMLGNLEKRRCYIGSDVDSGSENGVNVFSGCISRLEVWNKALSNEEINRYMDTEPDYAEGLVGQWIFCQGNYVNTMDFELAARRRGLEIGIGHEGQAPMSSAERAPIYGAMDEASRYRDVEIPLSCREEAISAIMSQQPDGGKLPDWFYMVNHFEADGIRYFVVHEYDGAYIVMDVSAGEIDARTTWMIELVLIIVGGVMSVLTGAHIIGGAAARDFILKYIAFNTVLYAVVSDIQSAGDVPRGIMQFMKALWDANVLRTLLKMCFHLSFFAVIQIMAGMLIRVISGGSSTLVEFTVLAASIMAHMMKYPNGGKSKIPRLAVREVLFHSRNGCQGSHYMRSIMEKENLERAEWRSSPTLISEPILYDAAGGADDRQNVVGTVHVWTRFFNQSLAAGTVIYLRGTDISAPALLGMSDVATYVIPNVPGFTTLIHFVFRDHNINNAPIRTHNIRIRWEYSLDRNQWGFIEETEHLVYIALDAPGGPWAGHPLVREYIEKSFDIVQGAVNKEEVAQRVTRYVNDGAGKYFYEVTGGISRYHDAVNNGINHLTLYLDLITPRPVRINCMDCAVLVIILSDIWGCGLIYQDLINVADVWNGFSLNEIVPVGFNQWAKLLGGVFRYHAVAVDSRGYFNMDKKIYDACLCVNAHPQPWGQTKIKSLPLGMTFSQNLGFPQPVEPAAPDDSYREHLCANVNGGANICCLRDVHHLNIVM